MALPDMIASFFELLKLHFNNFNALSAREDTYTPGEIPVKLQRTYRGYEVVIFLWLYQHDPRI